MKTIMIIGGGPGDASYILPAARQTAKNCDLVIGDKRMLQAFELKADGISIIEMGPMLKRLEWLKKQPDTLKVGILVSGDPLMYSMFRLVCRTFPEAEVRIVPGIGSIQAFAARLGESMEEAKVISVHGREMTGKDLSDAVRKYPKIFMLCDSERTPGWIARQLMNAGMEDVYMAAGSHISYPEEQILSGTSRQMIGKEWPALSLVMIKNIPDTDQNFSEGERTREGFHRLLCDEDFLRNQTPMTREEIRWIILGKLALTPDAVVWDVGAGTGSVAIECARYCPSGKVLAIEKNPRALEILRKNQRHLPADNMEIIEGTAPDILDGLVCPTHVFIGGAGRSLEAILQKLRKFGPGIRIVTACVTLETLMEACRLTESMEGIKRIDMLTIRIEKERPLGSYHLMEGGHPVTLIIAYTYENEKDRENAND